MAWDLGHNDQVVMLGDSITSILADRVRYWWRDFEAEALAALPTLIFKDSGVGSMGIAFFAGREAEYVTSKTPDAMCVALGVNDAIAGRSAATFRSLYDSFLDTCLAWKPTLKIALASPWILGWDPNASTPLNTLMDAYQAEVADMCAVRGLAFFDFRATVKAAWNPNLTYDGIHPDPLGVAQMSGVALAGTTLHTEPDPRTMSSSVIEAETLTPLNLKASAGTKATMITARAGQFFAVTGASGRCVAKTGSLGTSPQVRLVCGANTIVSTATVAFTDGVSSIIEFSLATPRLLADLTSPVEVEIVTAATTITTMTAHFAVQGRFI